MKAGDRIELVYTNDQYTNLKPGDQGTVKEIVTMPASMGGGRQIWIDWDSGSNLSMLPEAGDKIKVVG